MGDHDDAPNDAGLIGDSDSEPRGPGLTVLSGDGDRVDPPEVPLVRELKLPTLDHLDLDAEAIGDNLPRAVDGVEDALAEGDLEAVDGMLDEALGSVLQGPGHERRARQFGLVSVLLWGWCAVLLLAWLVAQFSGFLG